MKKQLATTHGFSAIELIITIAVSAAFVLVFYQLFTTVGTSVAASRQQALASNLAYTYLRKYTDDSRPTWFTCSTANGASNTNDLTVNSSATGQVIVNGTTTEVPGLPKPVTYTVRAIAPYGCATGSVNAGTPLRIEATIQYGSTATTVKHSTYTGF